MPPKILIITENSQIITSIQSYLNQESYQTFVAYNADQAHEIMTCQQPDLIALDVMMIVIDPINIHRILVIQSRTPLIIITPQTIEDNQRLGVKLGIDNSIIKPFNPSEFIAQVEVLLYHNTAQEHSMIRYRDIEVDLCCCEVHSRGKVIHLTPKEWKLLELLIKEPNRIFSRLELVERAFGLGNKGMLRTVDVHIKNLRKKIEPNPAYPTYIRTVYRLGYKFVGLNAIV